MGLGYSPLCPVLVPGSTQQLASSSFLCDAHQISYLSSSLLLSTTHSLFAATPSISIRSDIISGLLVFLYVELFQSSGEHIRATSNDVTASTTFKLHLTAQWRFQHLVLLGNQHSNHEQCQQPQHSSFTTHWHWSQS